ncbi:MAG: DUF6567 family protein [Bacteroidia bacterium]
MQIKSNIVLKFIAIGITLLWGSCQTLHYGTPTSSAQLTSANFKYIEQNVKGYSSSTYILGIGGNSHNGMIAEAKQDLLNYYPLKENQALVNVNVDISVTAVPGNLLIQNYTVVYSADIVEFIKDRTPSFELSNSDNNSKDPEFRRVDPRIDDKLFVYKNTSTMESYFLHPEFLKVSKKLGFNMVQNEIQKYYTKDGYFLPYIDELKGAYKEKKKLKLPKPNAVYWSADKSSSGKMKCLDFKTGEIVIKSITDEAYYFPLYLKK